MDPKRWLVVALLVLSIATLFLWSDTIWMRACYRPERDELGITWLVKRGSALPGERLGIPRQRCPWCRIAEHDTCMGEVNYAQGKHDFTIRALETPSDTLSASEQYESVVFVPKGKTFGGIFPCTCAELGHRR